MTLSKIDVAALRQADRVSFHRLADGSSTICATKEVTRSGPFDDRERTHRIDVESSASWYVKGSFAIGRPAPGNQIASIAMVYAYDPCWTTIARSLRAGDSIELEWIGDRLSNDYLRDADGGRLHADALRLRVIRPRKRGEPDRLAFDVEQRICADNSARMVPRNSPCSVQIGLRGCGMTRTTIPDSVLWHLRWAVGTLAEAARVRREFVNAYGRERGLFELEAVVNVDRQTEAVAMLRTIQDRARGKGLTLRQVAQSVADRRWVEELDASELTAAKVRELAETMRIYGGGELGGRAFIINEAHGLRSDTIRRLLVMLEDLPEHVLWVFTTTKDGQADLCDDHADAGPLVSRCIPIATTSYGVSKAFAERLKAIAQAEGLEGQHPPAELRARLHLRNEPT